MKIIQINKEGTESPRGRKSVCLYLIRYASGSRCSKGVLSRDFFSRYLYLQRVKNVITILASKTSETILILYIYMVEIFLRVFFFYCVRAYVFVCIYAEKCLKSIGCYSIVEHSVDRSSSLCSAYDYRGFKDYYTYVCVCVCVCCSFNLLQSVKTSPLCVHRRVNIVESTVFFFFIV